MGSPSRTKVAIAVFLAAVVLGGVLSVCVVFGPAWVVGNGSDLTTADRLAAENDVRSTLLQGLGGLLALGGVAAGAVMTLRQVRASREGHSIDLFTKAIDQLASDQVSVRHGGVYALEQLSELDARYRGHAHALLTAFVRRHAPWPPLTPEPEVPAARTPIQGGVADDVGAALAVLSRRAMIDALLRGTDLSGADLRGADLTRADLDGAILLGADLTSAELGNASLRGVIADNTTTCPDGFTPPEPEA
jgi:hypothetical protein